MLTKEKKGGQDKILKEVLAIIHRYFFFVVLVVFVIIIACGYIFLIEPKYIAVSEKVKAEEEQKTKELEDLTAYIDRLRQYRNKYNSISAEDKERIDGLISGKYLPESIFAEMEKLIFSRGLILNSINVAASQEKLNNADTGGTDSGQSSGVGDIIIKLDIAGVNYEGLKQLLSIMESNLHLLDVKKVDFSPEQNSAQLEVVSYYLN